MNRLSTLCLLAMAMLSGAPMSWADDAQNAPTPLAAAEKHNTVLGQPEPATAAISARQSPSADEKKAREAQALFSASRTQEGCVMLDMLVNGVDRGILSLRDAFLNHA